MSASRAMASDLYIYYRVSEADATHFAQAAARMQRELAQRHGVAAALKRRPQAQDGMHTWMEVYLAADDGFEAALAQAVANSDLPAFIAGERHVEHFVDVSPCA
ncbi:hypothetical protein GCM10007205_09430 [Oxalicibacterium flavum]|uniref:DUF4936 domain-containing protein n=1 Tax=Oxalicibacterium flavum TaxID=179467 RepID=A0A8J2ULJ5_9BURK|nr:DUF4936 family protein [Oxalicibacterium flavum]GGC02295.1 hypothetical protein GCM10007205_09430 [Oxalicibacterium flavum]